MEFCSTLPCIFLITEILDFVDKRAHFRENHLIWRVKKSLANSTALNHGIENGAFYKLPDFLLYFIYEYVEEMVKGVQVNRHSSVSHK